MFVLPFNSEISSPNSLTKQYILVRPYPSLRIIFVSPPLRIPGLLQSPFLSRIGGPAHVREGLSDAFESGAAVTAKVTWLPHGRGQQEDGEQTNGDSRPGSRRGGPPTDAQRTRYISCTPLLGSDDQVGVWMVVMVENELVTGGLTSRERALARYNNNGDMMAIPPTPSEYEHESSVMEENGAGDLKFERSMSGQIRDERKGKAGSEGGRLYADFMRNTNGGGNGGGGWKAGSSVEGKRINGDGVGFVNGAGRVEEVRSP